MCQLSRESFPNPLQCFRCQAYLSCGSRLVGGRCEKCAGGHETKECVVYLKKVVYVNCRGAHGAGDQRCLVKERQVEVARIRVVQKMSYAEPVKRVVEDDGSRVRDPKRSPVSRLRPIESDRNKMCLRLLFWAFHGCHLCRRIWNVNHRG